MPPPMGIRGGGGLGGGGSRLGLPSGWRTVYIQTIRNISLFSLYSKPILVDVKILNFFSFSLLYSLVYFEAYFAFDTILAYRI